MNRETVTEKLKTFMETECKIQIESDDKELDIDSFNMMLIITYVDSDLGITLDMDRLDFDAFTSLNTLTDLVLSEASVAA
tara:strand:- start:1678 stop:1917 length:240 start_codon:yes stop_codon:yes gene_type:complete